MPLLPKNLLQRIKDEAVRKVDKRVRQELAPSVPDTEVEKSESLPQTFVDKIKQKVQDIAPVQNLMLDPDAPLDLPTIKYRIRFAGQRRLLLLMTYNDEVRHVEPYSYRYRGKPKIPGGKSTLLFYGFCRIHNKIHAFDLEKIEGLIVTNEPYRPRWTIEV